MQDARWFPLVDSGGLGAEPVEAEAGGVRWVTYRPVPGGPAAVVEVRGLPLRLRDDLHVRSDRSGVALRRVLADLAEG